MVRLGMFTPTAKVSVVHSTRINPSSAQVRQKNKHKFEEDKPVQLRESEN